VTGDLDVIWHDLECGAYHVDLEVWHELADGLHGPILDVGCGTGRVALDLARRGHDVVGLDADERLLAALRRRAGGVTVETVCADAREFALDRRFPLILAPMQTVQLLGGAQGRGRFLACALAHLEPGGTLAMAIADPMEGAVDEPGVVPWPDMADIDGVVYASRAVAIVDEGTQHALVRVREIVDAAGNHTDEENIVRIDVLDPDLLEAEGSAAGLSVLPRREVPWTDEYVGSQVVMLGA
jgi:SAM-dependent methyltransferase